MGNLIRNFIGILLIPLAFALCYEAYLFVSRNLDAVARNWFIYGILAYLPVYLIVPANRIRFVEIFEHELGHMLVALFLLQDIKEFSVETNGADGGLVKHRGASNFLIGLAPYFLPVFTIPLLIIKPLIFSSTHNVINLLIGFSLAFHYLALINEFRPRQTDIQRIGLAFASVVTAGLNAVVLIIILSVVLNRYGNIPDYLKDSLVRARETYTLVLQDVRSRV